METIKLIVQILAVVSGSLIALMSILLFLRLHWPAPATWFLKIYVSALSQVFLLVGVWSAIAGLATGSVVISLIGAYDVVIFSMHIIRVTRPPGSSSSFEKAFGLNWKKRINPERKNHFVPRRTILRLPAVPKAHIEQNIPFATIPGTDRKLLCDIWQPNKNIAPSGLAFIYMHGAAWYLLDKDLGTRPFFDNLAAQGHVIIDVANRLAPETDMMGMVNDVKRAIIWMKENAGTYGINPDRIVVGGGSSGAHLALLAAYTANNPQFAPEESEGKDISVCAVVSLYGPADLEPMYYHLNQHLTTREIPGRPKKAVPSEMPGWIIKKMGKEYYRLGFDKGFVHAGNLPVLLGGHPDECPQTYARFSPVSHVHPGCPPTLLIHGEHDVMAPVKSTRSLYSRLVEEKVSTVMHILPQTDHAFDLQLPKISPSAHNAIYDVERFLALMSEGGVRKSQNNNNQLTEIKWKPQSQLQPELQKKIPV